MGEGDLHAIIALTLGATNQKQRIVEVRTGPLASQQWGKRKRGICSDGFGFFFAHNDVVVSPLQFFQEYIRCPKPADEIFRPHKRQASYNPGFWETHIPFDACRSSAPQLQRRIYNSLGVPQRVSIRLESRQSIVPNIVVSCVTNAVHRSLNKLQAVKKPNT